MKHYGDIMKINGAEVPVVDIITGGSPCQDLSVAGKRAGLAGERSGLFMEQMRIVKEMRERDRLEFGRTGRFVRPRYMVWENVPGAFSSGNPKGADFAAVIEEIIKVAEPGTSVSVCVPKGGWTKSGCYYAEDGSWSIAWRVHDAQFWGVPQRRKRISLVADFGGLSASEILFERKGLSRDSEPCGEAGQETARAAGGGVEGAISFHLTQDPVTRVEKTPCLSSGNSVNGQATVGVLSTLNNQSVLQIGCDVYNHEVTGEVAASLTAASGGTNTSGPKVIAAGFSFGQSAKARSIGFEEEVSPTLRGGEGGNQKPCVLCLNDQGGSVMGVSEDVTGALWAEEHGHQPIVYNGENITSPLNKADPQPGDPCHTLGTDSRNYLVYENHSQDSRYKPLGDVSETVSAKYGTGGNNQPLVVSDAVCVGNGQLNQMSMAEQANTLDTMHDQQAILCQKNAIVRRLTPMECERLQGYPDGWTDIGEWVDSKGKKHKDADSPRYKALGNSIALPFWQWMAKRISAQYERTPTMASLFDGIGGFPLVFSRAGVIPVWASEIEEFPMAVTKLRFPEE